MEKVRATVDTTVALQVNLRALSYRGPNRRNGESESHGRYDRGSASAGHFDSFRVARFGAIELFSSNVLALWFGESAPRSVRIY